MRLETAIIERYRRRESSVQEALIEMYLAAARLRHIAGTRWSTKRYLNMELLRQRGSIRRECLDHIVVFGDAHLRRILGAYTGYYNELRTHLSLNKDSPFQRPVQRLGQLAAWPILGGLHHHYCRM